MPSTHSISLVNNTNHQKKDIINFPSSLHILHKTTQISLQTPPTTLTINPSTTLHPCLPTPPPPSTPTHHPPTSPPNTQKPTHRPPRLHQQTAERMGPRPAQIRGMVRARLRTPVPGKPSSDESAVCRRQNRRAGKARE